MAVLLNASFAVTVTSNATPAVGGDPAVVVTTSDAAAAGLTVMLGEVPVIVPVTVSVPVIVCEPAVFRFAPLVNVLTPLVSVELAGNPLPAVAWLSVEVKCTVPG